MGDGDEVDGEDAPSPESPDTPRDDSEPAEGPEPAGTDGEPDSTETDSESDSTAPVGDSESIEPEVESESTEPEEDSESTDPEGESESTEPEGGSTDAGDPPFGDADGSAFGADGPPEPDWTDPETDTNENAPTSAADDHDASDSGAADPDAADPDLEADDDEPAEAAGGGVGPLIEDERDVHYEPDDPTEGDPETVEPEDLHGPPEVAEGATTPADLDAAIAPPDDQEMPLADHIDEMIKRLSVVVGVILLITLGVFPFAEEPVLYIWNNVLPPSELTAPRVYGPLELKLTELKFSMLAGFVIALPVFVYQTYLFMRPGLYPRERRYYLAAVPTSLVLAFIGLAFGYFLILPALFSYFLTYSQNAGEIAFALKQTFDLILMLEGYLALVFQIPLFIMLAIMMGLTTRDWLASRRIYFWGGFLGVSYLFGLDPTGVAPIMVAATMVVLFEGTLFLLKWTQRGN